MVPNVRCESLMRQAEREIEVAQMNYKAAFPMEVLYL